MACGKPRKSMRSPAQSGDSYRTRTDLSIRGRELREVLVRFGPLPRGWCASDIADDCALRSTRRSGSRYSAEMAAAEEGAEAPPPADRE